MSEERQHGPHGWLGLPGTAWAGLVAGAAAAGACYAAAGATLGLFFGGILFAALLVPPMCLAEQRLVDRMLVAAGINDGIAVVWLIAAITSPSVTFIQWLLCYALLAAWCFALAGLAHRAQRLVGSAIPASAMVVLLALVWLTCPIWLAPHLSRQNSRPFVKWVVPTHPLLATNGVMSSLGIWSERPIAYRYLLSLGQDVAYELPRNIWPAVVLYSLVGVATLLAPPPLAGKR